MWIAILLLGLCAMLSMVVAAIGRSPLVRMLAMSFDSLAEVHRVERSTAR